MSKPKKPADDAGRRLRKLMLNTPAEKMGVKPDRDFPRVYGILMDWQIDDQTATVFASSTGAASLYTTSTFGIIGGEGHEPVRIAAIRFVHAADRLVESSIPAASYPYPSPDHVLFYLLTFSGVRVVDTDMASIAAGTGTYGELFALGQNVLSELRRTVKRQ